MQGQRSSMGSLPDTISFDLNPTAADPNIDQDLFWNNNIQNYAHNMIPEYINSTTNNGSTYLNPTNQAQNLSGWNMGESSSSSAQNYTIRNEQKPEDVPINAITVNGVDLNRTNSQIPYSPLFMQSVGNDTYSQALNLGVEIGENSGTNRQVMEENVRAPSSSSGSGGYFGEEIYSNEGCPLSRKRKAIEGHIGQSSSNASPSYFQPRDRGNEWNNTPGWYHANLGSTTSLENPLLATPQDLLNEIPLPLNVTPNVENSRRNHRARLSSSPQQGPSPNLLPNGSISGNSNVITYPQSSRLLPLNNLSGTRTPQTRRWARGSSSRTGHSISFGERITRPNDEPDSNNLQRNLLDNPIFVPTNDTRDPPQLPPNWGLSRGTTSENNLSINENVSRSAHPMSNPSGVPHRSAPRYSRRLHEYVRRQLLSSPLPEPVGQNSNLPQQAGSSSQVAPSSGASGNNGDRLSRLRSALLLERQLDSAFGGANSSRGATAGPEGRSRLVSEIRNVLDQMRRGEGLRLEDMVILDQSGFFAMADIHDRHRDMRLDVDNMSYEELLALEERIGNVNTGLSEENIMNRLKQRKFFSIAMGAQSELEPCCICREEYNDGEDIGTVECGHEFHSGCVKQWLMLKNSCPICKTTALNN